MIFVTIGTHPGQFDRLVRKMDEIAGKIKEKVVIQRGFTRYKPVNADYFDFAPNLTPYFSKARIVISHSATSLVEFLLTEKKPLITIPRQAQFKEHINDHQVEFAEYLHHKMGVKNIINIEDLTPELITTYKKQARVTRDGLKKLQLFFTRLIDHYES